MSTSNVSRQTRAGGGAILSRVLAATGIIIICVCSGAASAQTAPYMPPQSPRAKFNFDMNWKFIRQDVTGAEATDFDDSAWTTVSTPHTYNDVDSFRSLIHHSSGDVGTYKGPAWYRKHFKLPADLAGRKIFLEFEGMRQAGDIFLNGQEVGLYENGVTAYGLDITDAVNFDNTDNVLAVKVDSTTGYAERATGTTFQWNTNAFNPDFGGINRHVWLHVTGMIYQTLPLYYGLETQGAYVYASNFSIADKSATVTVESEVRNESGADSTVAMSAVIVDQEGQVAAQLGPTSSTITDGDKLVMNTTATVQGLHFWSPDDPYLYTVYTILTANGATVDASSLVTGFRKTEFKGGAGTGGVFINDQFVYLKGFAQRASDEWAGLGQAYPDWMHDYTAQLIVNSHANYVRWMHVSPQRVDVDTFDHFGIVEVCPAGDKEGDVTGRQWDQRVEVMRASIIYYRNNPSILFYEAGNNPMTVAHLDEMVALRQQWDPNGGRVMGYRGSSNNTANTALNSIAEYYGVMIGQDPRTDALPTPSAMFRAYSGERRDLAPLVETEDFRDEAARRYWDNYSPPFYGFTKGPNDTYDETMESFAVGGIDRYYAYWINGIFGTDPAHSKWSGYASIYFSDSDADGRQDSSEVARVSGKVDAVRLPKELYYAHRVMQNPQPDIHIIGHWSYPSDAGAQTTVKTVYVVANTQSVELIVNGESAGVNSAPTTGYLFGFPNIQFAPGTLTAIGRNGETSVAQQTLTTAGAPAEIKLTATTGPQGFEADGADVALIDVEVVDANGMRVPTDDDRLDFTISGPGIWRGGYNSGIVNSTNNLYLNTECGINRVSVRSTLTAGQITVTASRPGLTSGSVTITSTAVPLTDGLSTSMPQHLPGPAASQFCATLRELLSRVIPPSSFAHDSATMWSSW